MRVNISVELTKTNLSWSILVADQTTLPNGMFSGSLTPSKLDVAIDTGNPFLHHTIHGFLKIGTVAAMRVAAEEIYYRLQKGKFSKHKFKHKLKKMYKEGTYWGTLAGAYVGMGHGIQRICGTRDWRNAMLSGALSGALISATKNNSRDRIMIDAITGGAIATAAELIILSQFPTRGATGVGLD